MSDSTFNADLDALVRGEGLTSGDDLTRFAVDVYREEHHVTMPHALKLRIASDLGLATAGEQGTVTAPISRRTGRAMTSRSRSSRPWAVVLTIAAALLLSLTGILRWGLPAGDEGNDNRFLGISPAVPTVEATPAAESEWLTPYTDADCPDDGLMNRGEWMQLQAEQAAAFDPAATRQDEPYGTPDSDDAEAAANRQRQAMACVNSHKEVNSDALPKESSRWSWENSVEGAEHIDQIRADRIERSKAMSAYVENELGIQPADLAHPTDSLPGPVWDPANAILMADGRVALIPGWLTPLTDVPSHFSFFAPVWTMEHGEWRLDEELFFCIGDCDEYWQRVEGTSAVDATPFASPEVSDEYDASWMLPVDPDVCTTVADTPMMETGPQDFDSMPRREYNIIGPANTADALDANQTARLSQACDDPKSLWSTRLASDNGLSREQVSPFTIALLQQQWEDGQVVSDALEANGMQPTDFTLVAGGDNPMFAEVEDGTYWLTNPYMALALEDGRIVMPWVEVLVSKDDMSGSRIESPFIGTALVLLEENGEWKIDGQLPICVGECDEVWPQFHEIFMDALWLMPVSVEECERNDFLPADISESSAAAIKSRQSVACELNGDAGSLLGPEYRVTEGEDARPLSEEIESLHRGNDQTPGSLQRIAQTSVWPEDVELPTDPWSVFQPGSVVTLDDGRVAVLESTVVTPDGVAGSGRTSPVVTTALVWIVDGNSWLLDEEATVCLGDCDVFWANGGVVDQTTPAAVVIPETCQAGQDFQPDLTSDNRIAVGLRPGPGMSSGTTVATVPAGSELMFLCESAETENPAGDRMNEGQVWLKVRTEDGTEGWIREIDVEMLD